MKNFKVFLAVLVVVTTSIFIYSCAKDGADNNDVKYNNENTKYRVAEPCENALGNCNNVLWTIAPSANFSLSQYPGCNFEVQYKYRFCNGKFDVMIMQWGDWPPCAQFNQDIANDPFIISKVEKMLMSEVVNVLLQNPNIIIPPCGSGHNISFGFSTSSCINFCIIPNGTYTTTNGEVVKVKYVKTECGEACCKTTYEVCKSANGGLNITIGISQGTGNCSNQVPNIPCPINSIGSTGCIPNCYLL